MEEVWKDIRGYDGLYMVSNTGKVRSMDWNRSGMIRELRTFDNGGYRRIAINRNGARRTYLVHRLVADAFLDNPYNLPFVNHIDGDKTNNCVSNLEWVSASENTRHAIVIGLRPPNVVCQRKRGKENKNCKPIFQYDRNGNLIKRWQSSFEVVETLGYDRHTLTSCCAGHKPSYRGFIWRYY